MQVTPWFNKKFTMVLVDVTYLHMHSHSCAPTTNAKWVQSLLLFVDVSVADLNVTICSQNLAKMSESCQICQMTIEILRCTWTTLKAKK